MITVIFTVAEQMERKAYITITLLMMIIMIVIITEEQLGDNDN